MPDEAIGTSIDPAVILGELLEKLRDPAVAPPSDAAAEAAIELCGQLAAHLRMMSLKPSPGLVMMQVTAADGPAAEAEPNAGAGTCCATAAACTCAASEAGTDSACVTSESDSDHTSTLSRSRPSARARARLLRRRQEQGQQEQEQEQHGQQQLLQGASTGPADLQWQQWQWQWQGIGTHTHAPGQPLPRLQEHQVQQEEHFRSSLWNGGWVMAPVALAVPMAVPMAAPMASPSPPYHPYDPRRPAATSSAQQPQRLRHARDKPPRVRAPPSEAAFQQQLWSGGWQMVPLQEEPSSETPGRAQSGQPRWRGTPPTQPPTEPPAEPPQPPTRPPQPPTQPPEEQQQQQQQQQQGAHGQPGQQGEEEVYIVQQQQQQRHEKQQQQRHEKQQQQRPLHEKQPLDGEQGAADGGARDPGDLPACREEGSPEAIQTRPRGGEPEPPQGLPQGEREDANEEEEAPRGGREVVEGGGSEPSSEAWSEA